MASAIRNPEKILKLRNTAISLATLPSCTAGDEEEESISCTMTFTVAEARRAPHLKIFAALWFGYR